MPLTHKESHRAHRIGWLRAAVLGANDGTISVASLVVGVAASGATPANILLTGVAGLVAGAMSMAAGEYVSVQSQADTEGADLAREKRELESEPERELDELTSIYVSRGLDEPLARRVAEQLTSSDALGAHARDELGITETLRARPVQAAIASAIFFAVGAAVPIATAMLAPAARDRGSIGTHVHRHAGHPRRHGCICRRRLGRERRAARCVLGRARHGPHRRRRSPVRRRRLKKNGARRRRMLFHP